MTSPLLCKDDDEEVASNEPVVITHPAAVVLMEDDEEIAAAEAEKTTGQMKMNKRRKEVSEKQNGQGEAGDHYVLAADTLEESTSLLLPAVEDHTNWERGQVQPEKYRDWPYAVIFWIQFLCIAIYGVVCFGVLGSQSNGSMYNHGNVKNDRGVVGENLVEDEVLLIYGSTLPLLLSFCFVFLFTLLFNSQKNIERLIYGSQCLIIISSILVTIAFLIQGLYLAGFFAALSSILGIWYLIVIQNRIPFAAANLHSGFHAVRSNKGVIMAAIFHWIVFAGWFVLWCTSLYNAMGIEQVCDEDESSCEVQFRRPGWIFPWMFSLFWTVQVVKYTVQTIVAGVSATWYFTPQEASSFCSSAVRSSIQRSLTTSFGSVCFGALLVAVIQFLDWLVKNLRMRRSEDRNHGGGGGVAVEALLLCCLDCILSLMEDIVQYFNKWAFIYVGVYGYPYLTAGKKVMTLFGQRGWTVIINDNLVSNALALMGFIIAVLSLFVSSLLLGNANASFLIVGSIVAVTFISVLIYVVESAVNTIIVCFAEAPAELGRNHLMHDREMRESWQKVYPTFRSY
eukprot:CAMPEP_0176482992 /NCGR_PEP_ID=MMETSP0200_2-20121128/3684_1 /TAXON_ID=947934 /ORGANISM="Chaetoceros sp., Strain GSL56" /LENGTH=565 /DNA_ID=CAMNT_0017879371 /DNA_START=178 /DNA_END=1875 /DNA_ORIENTATION=+